MPAPILDPFSFTRARDFFNAAGKLNPGIAKVSGFDRPYGWDVKKGKGTRGATITLTDYPPAKGKVKILLWTQEHFQQINEWLALFQYDSTKRPATPVDVWHPDLASNGVSSVVCTNIGPLVHEGKGLFSIEIELLEYWPPPKKSATSTPKGSKTGDKKTTPGSSGDPIADAKQAEIEKLLKKAKEP